MVVQLLYFWGGRELRVYTVIAILVAIVGLPIQSEAALIDRGVGMIYDTDQGITWLQDAGLGCEMPWDEAMNWAANLSFGGFSDRRLPDARNPGRRRKFKKN